MKNTICTVDGCEKATQHGMSLCGMHQKRKARDGVPGEAARRQAEERAVCLIPGCQSTSKGRGLCQHHYNLTRRYGFPCPHVDARKKLWV